MTLHNTQYIVYKDEPDGWLVHNYYTDAYEAMQAAEVLNQHMHEPLWHVAIQSEMEKSLNDRHRIV